MTETQSFELDVLRGFAAELAGNALAKVTLLNDDNPTHNYPDSGIGIYIDRWPEVKGGTVTLTDYTVSDDIALSDSVLGVQMTIKHRDMSIVKAIASDAFNLIHGRGRGMLGPVTLVSALRTSGTNMGQDSNGRQGRTENYYLTLHRPSLNRS